MSFDLKLSFPKAGNRFALPALYGSSDAWALANAALDLMVANGNPDAIAMTVDRFNRAAPSRTPLATRVAESLTRNSKEYARPPSEARTTSTMTTGRPIVSTTATGPASPAPRSGRPDRGNKG